MKKKIVMMLLATCMLTACGQKENEIDIQDVAENMSNVQGGLENVNDEQSDEAVIDNTNSDDLDDPWRSAYLDYLTSSFDYLENDDSDYTFTLFYLDDNDIPELFIDTGVEAGGQLVVTYYNKEIIEQQLPRRGSQYIERSGLLYTDTGSMDYYPVSINKLENGTFTEIGSGVYYVSKEDREKMANDENYPYTLTYEWEGEIVTEDQFNENVADLYDLDKSKTPDNYYSYDEILNVIETGKWLSYNHTYEFIAGDMTWEEAQEACKEKGGYLATITCKDEAEVIAAMIQEQGFEDYALYVGFRSSEWIDDKFYGSRWINADGSYEDMHLSILYEYSKHLWRGYDSDTSRDDIKSECGVVMYDTQEDNFFFYYGAPQDIVSETPEYAGRVGYICEYDS